MRLRLAALLVLIASPAAAQALDEPAIRAFLARQERLWNAGDLEGYFATFTPDARFDDRAVVDRGETASYGVSTVAQARANARRLLAGGPATESSTVLRIHLYASGRIAKVLTRETTRIEAAGKVRTVCADSVHLLRATPAGVRSAGQTDYIRRCR